MKFSKTIIPGLIIILLSNFALAQNTCTWSGASSTSYTDTGNWEGGIVPAVRDNVIFNISADVTDVPPISSTPLGSLQITTGAHVSFTFSTNGSLFNIDQFFVESGASFRISQAGSATLGNSIVISTKAEISGSVFFNNGAHKLYCLTSAANISFFDGGRFKTGMEYPLAYPLGESSLIANTVTFYNGSEYYHGGGNTPFGLAGEGSYVCVFEPDSRYYIMDKITTSNQVISFAGKTYGHITNLSGDILNINEDTLPSITSPFTFSSMTSENGGIEYNSPENMGIVVAGAGINAKNGDIKLISGTQGVVFTATESVISGLSEIILGINRPSASTNIIMVPTGNTLKLNNNLYINGTNLTAPVDIQGTIDCSIYSIYAINVTLTLKPGGTIVTANPDGVQAGIPYLITELDANYIYNSNEAQITGLSGYASLPAVNLTVTNNSFVTMDADILVNSLNLQYGDLNIGNYVLNIKQAINYTSGTLSGNKTSSILVIETTNPEIDIELHTPLELSKLKITQLNPNLNLVGSSTLFIQDYLELSSGSFSINDAELFIDGGMLLISGTNLIGGTNATLTFGENFSTLELPIPSITLGTLTNFSNTEINMSGEITINNLLNLNSGTLNIQQQNLNLYGVCEGAGTITTDYLSGINVETSADYTILPLNYNDNTIGRITINTPGEVFLTNGAKIDNLLALNGGKLSIYAADLILSSSAVIKNDVKSSYIVTKGEGYVKKEISSTQVLPIGTMLYNSNITIGDVTTAETFSIRVFDEVYDSGYSGNIISEKVVNLTWDINPMTDNTYNLNLEWNVAAEDLNFDINNCYISYFINGAWDEQSPAAGTQNGEYSNISRTGLNDYGLFHVSSNVNYLPSSANFDVFTAKNRDYKFHSFDFPFFDTDGDTLQSIMIKTLLTVGTLYIDDNASNTVDAGEKIITEQTLSYSEILSLRFKPFRDEIGDMANNFNYSEFGYTVSDDGTAFSENPNICTIHVSDNAPPIAENQTFSVEENSPLGTIVGQIIVSDPNEGQTVIMRALSGDTLTFEISPAGEIRVKNPSEIVFDINPQFIFEIGARDNGLPHLFTNFTVQINVIKNTAPEFQTTNLITPNNDGYNDYWIITGAPDVVKDYETIIMDNAGKIVFRSQAYYNNWDGTFNGKKLPPGIYYYILKSPNNETKGTITLLR